MLKGVAENQASLAMTAQRARAEGVMPLYHAQEFQQVSRKERDAL